MSQLVDWHVPDFQRKNAETMVAPVFPNAVVSRSDYSELYWSNPCPSRALRGAAYTVDRDLIPHSQRYGGVGGDQIVAANPKRLSVSELNQAQLTVKRGTWLYIGPWMNAFGHFLVESLPMLWPALDSSVTFDGICATRALPVPRTKWQDDIFRNLGLPQPLIVNEIPVSFENLIVPTRAYDFRHSISPLANDVWCRVGNSITGDADPDVSSRIYLSRTHFDPLIRSRAGDRYFSNSAAVDEEFARRGFDVIYPERLTVNEQIAIAGKAKVIAGPGGSALHLSAFQPEGGRVIELGDRRHEGIILTQQAISNLKDQPISQIPFRAGDSETDFNLDYLGASLDLLTT